MVWGFEMFPFDSFMHEGMRLVFDQEHEPQKDLDVGGIDF